MIKGICLLCGKFDYLSIQSHIIPKFMYKGMEDERNKISESILKNNIKTEKEIDYRYFDKNILCVNCETVKLGRLDNYGNRVLFGNQKVNDSFRIQNYEFIDGKMCEIKGIEYSKFKLFLLSILWRANVSKHDFFENINLNSKETIIRNSIQNSDAFLCETVDISIIGLMIDRNNLYKVLVKPRHIITDTLDVYSFVIYGIVYNFIFKDSLKHFHIGESILKKNQTIKIPFYIGENAKKFLKSFAML